MSNINDDKIIIQNAVSNAMLRINELNDTFKKEDGVETENLKNQFINILKQEFLKDNVKASIQREIMEILDKYFSNSATNKFNINKEQMMLAIQNVIDIFDNIAK